MKTHDNGTIEIHVVRSGRWWAISVPSQPSVFSQCRRLEQVDDYAREAIALGRGCTPDEVGELDVSVAAPDDVASLITHADQATAAARTASAEAMQARRQAAFALSERGYPTRDIGALLGISHQRVSQLLTDPSERVPR